MTAFPVDPPPEDEGDRADEHAPLDFIDLVRAAELGDLVASLETAFVALGPLLDSGILAAVGDDDIRAMAGDLLTMSNPALLRPTGDGTLARRLVTVLAAIHEASDLFGALADAGQVDARADPHR